MKRSRKIIAAFVLLSLFLSCSKNGPAGNALRESKKMTPVDTVWTFYLNESLYAALLKGTFCLETLREIKLIRLPILQKLLDILRKINRKQIWIDHEI